jgi:arylsulfatase
MSGRRPRRLRAAARAPGGAPLAAAAAGVSRIAAGAAGVALASVALAACTPAEPPRAPAAGPELLLVTIDTLRADALACYGGAADVGRAVCAVGDAGIRYQWAFSTAPSTAPAIASILTSRYPDGHGVSQFATTTLPEDIPTLAQVLRQAGYATGAFVSNPVLRKRRRLDRGFDVYDDEMTRAERNRPALREREAEAATDAALAWARAARPPRFLWVHYQDPHGPYAPPGAARAAARPRPRRSGGPVLPVLRDHSGKGGIPAYQRLRGLRRVEDYAERYRDEIRYLDGHFARLLAGPLGAERPLAVLVTADHGEAFGEDGYYFAHGHSVGLSQLRVPLLWRPAEVTPPGVVRTAVSTLDVAPTLLAAAGVPIPPAFRGRPLPLAEPPDSPPRAVFSEHRARAAVVAGDRYFARDRVPIGPAEPDRISGGLLEPLPPRGAVLPESDALPGYRPPVDAETQTLERLLEAHLERHATRPPESSGAEQEELRALGYLE